MRFWIVATMISWGLAAATAQEPAAAAARETVDVRVYEYSLLVRDADGRPMEDLEPEDLTLASIDEATIEFLEKLFAAPIASPAPRAGRFRITLGGKGSQDGGKASASGKAYVLLVDGAHGLPAGGDGIADVLVDYVAGRLDEGDELAVLSYDGRLAVEQGFTANHGEAAEAIEEMLKEKKPRSGFAKSLATRLVREVEGCAEQGLQANAGGDDGIPSLPDPGLGGPDSLPVNIECLGLRAETVSEEIEGRFLAYLSALEAGVDYAGSYPDPVSMLVLSHGAVYNAREPFVEAMRFVYGEGRAVAQIEGYFQDVDDEAKALQELAAKAAAKGVVLHFIDASSEASGRIGSRRRGMYRTNADPARVAWEAGQTSLRLAAEESGGSFRAERDVAAALDAARHDDEGRYRLGVRFSGLAPGAEPPALELGCRSSDCRVRVGRGIAPMPEDVGTADARREGDARPSNDVIYARLMLAPSEPTTDGYQIAYIVGLNAEALDYEDSGKKLQANLEFTISLVDAEGQTVSRFYRALNHAFSKAAWEAQNRGMVGIRGVVEAPAGRYRLVVDVRNSMTGVGGIAAEELFFGAP